MNVFFLALKSDEAINEFFLQEEEGETDSFISDPTREKNNPLIEEEEKGLAAEPKLKMCRSEEISDVRKSKKKGLEDPFAEQKGKVIRKISTESEGSTGTILLKGEASNIRGAIFNLIILSLGTGCLSLPRYVATTSLCLSIFIIIFVGFLQWWAMSLMAEVCSKENVYNYAELLKKYYGKAMGSLYNGMVCVYCFGIQILHQVVSKNK